MAYPFDLSYQIVSYGTANPARHGKIWTDDDYGLLDQCVKTGESLKNMCRRLERSADGVIAKLRQGHYLDDNNFIHYPPHNPITKDDTMNHTTHAASVNTTPYAPPIIEHRTLIQGKDASTMNDAEIFQLIAKLEGKIASLQQIKAQSKKLAAHIEELQADVNKLVEFVDAR